jgi:hypothetical protein
MISYARNGFQVGEVQIVPTSSRVAQAVVTEIAKITETFFITRFLLAI